MRRTKLDKERLAASLALFAPPKVPSLANPKLLGIDPPGPIAASMARFIGNGTREPFALTIGTDTHFDRLTQSLGLSRIELPHMEAFENIGRPIIRPNNVTIQIFPDAAPDTADDGGGNGNR